MTIRRIMKMAKTKGDFIKEVADNVKTQLFFYIMMKGCGNIKCKNCYLKVTCSHEPAKSKDIAMTILKQGIAQGKAYMIIRQEETSPMADLFYGLHVYEALNLVKDCSETLVADTDLLKEACNETKNLLDEYIKKIDTLEKKLIKDNARNRVLERIHRGCEND